MYYLAAHVSPKPLCLKRHSSRQNSEIALGLKQPVKTAGRDIIISEYFQIYSVNCAFTLGKAEGIVERKIKEVLVSFNSFPTHLNQLYFTVLSVNWIETAVEVQSYFSICKKKRRKNVAFLGFSLFRLLIRLNTEAKACETK